MMHTKTRNIVVGGSYASTIFLSYIGLLFYNSQYQAINTGYILVFCLFEAFFLRIAIGPIIVPANPQPKPNKVSMSQNLFRQQATEKNYFNQNNTIKIDTG